MTLEENLDKTAVREDYEKEEWGGWKIVSNMLDNPDENGIYPTSKCYKELYEFVVDQKSKAVRDHNGRILKGNIAWNKGLKGVSGRYRILKDKKCKVCGTIFRPKSSLAKYCSYPCALKDKPKKGEIIKCFTCSKLHYRKQSEIFGKKYKNNRYFCSRKCKANYDYGGKIELVCKICGIKYKNYKSQIRLRGSSFCSKDCMKKYQRTLIKSKDKSAYKKKLWLVFSRFIRMRDGGICISCGKQGKIPEMDAGHYIPKSMGLGIYFDEKNVNCQCTRCNRFMHGNLAQYAIALRRKYGETILEELEWKRQSITKIDENDYIQLIGLYKDKLKSLYDNR